MKDERLVKMVMAEWWKTTDLVEGRKKIVLWHCQIVKQFVSDGNKTKMLRPRPRSRTKL